MKTKLTAAQKQMITKWSCLILSALLFVSAFAAIPRLADMLPRMTGRAADLLLPDPVSEESEKPQFSLSSGKFSPTAQENDPLPDESTEPDENGEYEPENSVPEAVPGEGDKPVYPSNLCWYEIGDTPKMSLLNRTKYSINLKDFLKRDYPIKGTITDEPLVLIVHTHGTESYLLPGYEFYNPSNGYRSHDEKKTVVHVGEVLCEKLKSLGINAVHDNTMYDKSNYNQSYVNARKGIQSALEKYPSIKYVIDLHRDSVFDSSGKNIKPLTEIDGEKCAQLMLVIGTDQGGAVHPNWRDNLTFATYLQNEINELFPTLMRPINLRTAAFNQSLTKGSIILEVGSCGNNMTEAENAILNFAEAYAKLLKDNM